MHKLVKNQVLFISFAILTIGVLFKLAISGSGNFIFNMDNARDFVDVREMVELRKPRLTGPSTPIDGFFNGPLWYYFLAIGYIVFQGDPYGAIILQIILWAIGGFFLLKLVKNIGIIFTIPIGLTFISSNYIVLANLYSFNPTPVTLLAPLFIYLLIQYLDKAKTVYIFTVWMLAGLFFNLEMNFGIFTPLIILISVILTGKSRLLKEKSFWLGSAFFILALLPQVIFDIKHQFLMSKAILRHISENTGSQLNILDRIREVALSFYNTFVPTVFNSKLLAWAVLIFFIPLVASYLIKRGKEKLILVSLIFIFTPFIGYIFLPVAVNPWHLGAEMSVSLILIAYILKRLTEGGLVSKIISISLYGLIVWFACLNIYNFFMIDRKKPNMDPSAFRNEIAAIDYVYKHAEGKNFKVYAYLPSIIDYPYQYLIWWYGQKTYGYLPVDYAYAPSKTPYISNKKAFSATEEQIKRRESSNLVFLIKEPDRKFTRPGWEGEFIDLPVISKEIIGPLEIEIRSEL